MTSPTASDLNKVWGISRGDIFAVGKNGTILHYHDSSVTTTTPPEGTGTTTTAGTTTSTTTSIYDDSTSPTSTRQCPFRRSSADGTHLQSLRELRNRKLNTAIGAMLATMYYQNMTDITA